MTLLAFLIGLLVASIAFVILWPTGRKKAIGICQSALDQTVRKNRKVMQLHRLIKEHGEMTNRDAQEALSVSHATAARYFDALEAQGFVEQVGETGRSVFYKLK